jgi:flagellar biosynthetic protein FliO
MDFLQPLAAICLVLGLLAAALLLLKKRGAATFRLPGSISDRLSGGAQRKLEVLERVALGPQHSVHLVRVGDRQVLIGTAPTSCQLLESWPRTGGEL